MLPDEIQKKIKLIEISTRKLVNNQLAGEYHTAFKGQGMTFAEFREYVPGDDVRNISWNMMAKTGTPYLKKFDEERELTLMLAIDISASHDFGSHEIYKGEVLTYLCAALAFSAVKNNDHIGLLLFSDCVELYIPPKKGRAQVQRILRELLYFKPRSTKTNISIGLNYLLGVLKKKATIFVMSDYIDEKFEQPLRQLGKKHDVISVVVEDQLEIELPDIGLVTIQDPETGEIMVIDSSSQKFRLEYHSQYLKAKEMRDKLLRQSQVDTIHVRANENFFDPLVRFFQSRHRT